VSLVHVSTRSPRPASPISVSRRPPSATARREISARPRVISAARAARALAHHHGIEMPITEAVASVLDGTTPVRDAVEGLLRREPKAEER